MKVVWDVPNIFAKDMADGQVAIITEWDIEEYVGAVVQRYGDHLVLLGEGSWRSFPDIFVKNMFVERGRVQCLPKGTLLEL